MNLKKELEVKFIEFESITETGYWYNSYGLRGLLFKYERENLLSLAPKGEIGQIRFRLDPNRKIFTHRKLYQLKDAISFLGGLMKGLTVFVFIIVWPFREISFYRTLVNEMFRICDKPEKMKKMVNITTGGDSSTKIRSNYFPSNTSLHEEGLEIDQEVKDIVNHLEDIKIRYTSGGLFYRLIEENKQEIIKEVEEDLLSKKAQMMSHSNINL